MTIASGLLGDGEMMKRPLSEVVGYYGGLLYGWGLL